MKETIGIICPVTFHCIIPPLILATLPMKQAEIAIFKRKNILEDNQTYDGCRQAQIHLSQWCSTCVCQL